MSALTGQNCARGTKLKKKLNLGGLERIVFFRGAKITTLKNLEGQKCN